MTIQSTEACEAAALISCITVITVIIFFSTSLPVPAIDLWSLKAKWNIVRHRPRSLRPIKHICISTVTTVSKLSTHGQGLTEGMVWVMPRPRDDRRLLMLGCAYDWLSQGHQTCPYSSQKMLAWHRHRPHSGLRHVCCNACRPAVGCHAKRPRENPLSRRTPCWIKLLEALIV